VLIFTIIFTT